MYHHRPQSYGYSAAAGSSATIRLDEEVKLTTTSAERELHDSLAELYSVIVTLDAVEKAYIKDSIPEAAYSETCDRLLKHYRAILRDETVSHAFHDLDAFKREWQMEYPRATDRLRIGLPATVEQASSSQQAAAAAAAAHGAAGAGARAAGTAISDATENFITFLDAVKIHIVAKDSLHPLLSDVITSVNRVTGGADFDGRPKIVEWLIVLNRMKANEEISEAQARELSFDIEQAYYGFKATLR
ncbi:MAG: Vacuolar protein-sorting-associated protein 28 [Phylliscum demangeonii]|nr:MAG: Vacuolar protein-sorting-associated protein 28 [Phylliscum demangeonii]